MTEHAWVEGFSGAVTVCDERGILLAMNEKAAQAFSEDGGRALIGTSVLDCHPEPARSRLADLLENPRTHVYTIEKKGVKKLIYQAPWHRDGRFAGLVELSLEVPFETPHFVRDRP